MGIYCRKETGIFYAKKMINGILMRISLKTKNKMQAYSIYSEWENRLLIAKLNGDEKLPLPLSCQQKLEAKKAREINKPTLLQAFNEHLKVSENKHITESHMLSKKQIKKLIISQKIDWDDLTQENILKIQGKLRAEFSIHTVYKLIAHLKTFLNYAVKQGFISYDTYKRLDFMKRPPRSNSRIKFSDEDMIKVINRLIETHDIDTLYYIITLFSTVSRPAEIRNLTLKNLNFSNNTIDIWMNKTKDSKPMPMDRSFLDCLGNLMKITSSPQGHIFYGGTLPPKKGERHYSDKFAKLRDELGLNPRLNLYKIRHTAISQAAKTHGIAVAQQMAGHKSIRTTLQNYCVPDTANVEKAQKDLLAKVMER